MTVAPEPSRSLDSTLLARLDVLAAADVLLVACDFDGTLAEIVLDPASARAQPQAIDALQSLADLARTHVAVVSGRSRRELIGLTAQHDAFVLVGSHGAELDEAFGSTIAPAATELLDEIYCGLTALAATPGVRLERKSASIAVHYREVRPDQQPAVVEAVLGGPATITGVRTMHGKKVVELSVVEAHKGSAVAHLRKRFSATAVLFIGDDVTDEDAFAVLTGSDLGIKVGPGATSADQRVRDPVEVTAVLVALLARRSSAVPS